MVVQGKVAFFYWLREAAGVVFLVGMVVYFTSFFIKKGSIEAEPA